MRLDIADHCMAIFTAYTHMHPHTHMHPQVYTRYFDILFLLSFSPLRHQKEGILFFAAATGGCCDGVCVCVCVLSVCVCVLSVCVCVLSVLSVCVCECVQW